MQFIETCFEKIDRMETVKLPSYTKSFCKSCSVSIEGLIRWMWMKLTPYFYHEHMYTIANTLVTKPILQQNYIQMDRDKYE